MRPVRRVARTARFTPHMQTDMNEVILSKLSEGEVSETTITRDQVRSFLLAFNREISQTYCRFGRRPASCILPSHYEFLLKAMTHFDRMASLPTKAENDELYGVNLFFSAEVDKFVFGYRSGELP